MNDFFLILLLFLIIKKIKIEEKSNIFINLFTFLILIKK